MYFDFKKNCGMGRGRRESTGQPPSVWNPGWIYYFVRCATPPAEWLLSVCFLIFPPVIFSFPLLQYLCHFLLALARWVDPEVWPNSRVAGLSWALLQDCYTSDLCLREPAHLQAIAMLYLAMHCCRLHVPGSDQATRPWWQALCPEVSEDKLQQMSLQIMQCINEANGNVT